jgi:hypothetical protein
MQRLAAENQGDPDMCSDAFRPLEEPLKKQIKDLRSAVVREACHTIEFMSQVLHGGFKQLACLLLPTMVDATASGNKVRAGVRARASLCCRRRRCFPLSLGGVCINSCCCIVRCRCSR